MRFTRFVFSFLAVMAMSACTTQPDGSQRSDVWEWMNGRPSKTEQNLNIRMPTGYTGFNDERGPLVKPPGSPAAAKPPASWNQIENYDMPVAAHDNVTVYPVEPQDTMLAMDDYGHLVQQIYFLHASSHLTPREKSDLRNLAASLIQTQSGALAVTVVGHASQRVDGVSDPVRRKMINFEMAQKRANAVTNELNRAGLNPAWVQSVSKGDEEPNMNPGNRSQEAADRRVDVFVAGQ